MNSSASCSQGECTNVPYSRGLCWKHSRQTQKRAECSESGCLKPRHSKALCSTHYKQFQRNGNCTYSKEEMRQKERASALWSTRRMRLEEFEQRLAEQDYGCAICGSKDHGGRNWHVDHDHKCCSGPKSCGKCTRGLLCHTCNTALSWALDHPEWWAAAEAYLGRHAALSI